MRVIKIFLFYFSGLIFLAGCPTGCQDGIETIKVKMGKAELAIQKVQLLSNLDPLKLKDRTPVEEIKKAKRTSVCHELKTIGKTLDDKEIAIYVDANATKDGAGTDWDDAMRSIGGAVKKAFDNRQQLLSQGNTDDKPIYILVAAGVYSLTHEKTVQATPGFGKNNSLINFEGDSPYYHSNIKILGGFLPRKDDCVQMAQNDPNYRNDRSRDTILDGEGTSNSVVNIKGQAERIEISDFIVKNGRAVENKPDDKNKLLGGAVIIHGGSHDITLKNIKMEDSHADNKGGCLAIFGTKGDTPHDIDLIDVSAHNCTAELGGGGIYIGGDAHSISTKTGTIDLQKNKAIDPSSLGGGLLLEDDAGAAGAIVLAGNIIKNEAGQFGGGIAIKGNSQNINFSNIHVNENEVHEADGEGGGVYIADNRLDDSLIAGFTDGTISRNKAGLYGGGVMITNTGAPVPTDPMPAAKISFANIDIVGNELAKNDGSAKGAGVMLFPGTNGTGDIRFDGGSISENKAEGSGVGLTIIGNIHHVSVRNIIIDGNKTVTPQTYNGKGVYITEDSGVSPSRIIFAGGSIDNHEGSLQGSGLFVEKVIKLDIRAITFRNNHSEEYGGAFFATRCNINHENNTYENNTAKLSGGALAISESMDVTLARVDQPFGMKDITCTGNSTTNAGGCAYIEGAPGTIIEGGRYTDNGKESPTKGINAVTAEGGAIYFKSFSISGLQTLLTKPFLDADKDANAQLIIEGDSVFEDNAARHRGGALYAENVFDFTIRELPQLPPAKAKTSKFKANTIKNGDGGAIFVNSAEYKKSLSGIDGALAFINGAEFEANSAKDYGGAIYFGHLNKLVVNDAKFNQNNAENGNGGAIFAFFVADAAGTELKLGTGTSFIGNHADDTDKMGGGVFVSESPKEVTLFSTFKDNTADAGGGGLCLDGSQPIERFYTSSNTKFENNIIAQNDGGGLLVTVEIDNLGAFMGTFRDNKAPRFGGGVAFLADASSLKGGDLFNTHSATFDGNQSPEHPSLYFAQPKKRYHFVNTSFLNHHRDGAGTCGGALTLGVIDELKLEGGAISNNSAQAGGAFCIDQITTDFTTQTWWDGSKTHFTTVNDNHAKSQEGGFMKVKIGSPTLNVALSSSSFSRNSAQLSGGVINIPEVGYLTLNSHFYDNSSLQGAGGAFAIAKAIDFTTTFNTIDRNTAYLNGGFIAINTVTGSVTLDGDNLTGFFERLLSRAFKLPGANIPHLSFKVKDNKSLQGNGGAFYFGDIGNQLTLNNPIWLKNTAMNGDGGTLFANNINGNVNIHSGLMYSNQARNGGALFIGDLHGQNFTMTHTDDYTNAFDFAFRGKPIEYFIEPKSHLANPAHVLPAADALYQNKWGLIDGRGLAETRGIFLVEKNEAGNGNGGAFYIHNAKDVDISKISFGGNKAPVGMGGTIYATLSANAIFTNTIFYEGEAKLTGGAVYLESIGQNAELGIDASSIQKSKITQARNNCAGGLHGHGLKALVLSGGTSFYGNEVHSQNAANICAGALRWTQDATIPGEDIDAMSTAALPLNFENNRIIGPTSPLSRGTILIPSAIHDAWPALYGALHAGLAGTPIMVGTQINNVPPPSAPANELKNVIGRGP